MIRFTLLLFYFSMSTFSVASSTDILYFDGSRKSDFKIIQEANEFSITEVSDPLMKIQGRKVLKFSVNDTDIYPLTPTENPRAQAISHNFITPGMVFFWRLRIYLPDAFPENIKWLNLGSVYGKPYKGPSPVSLYVQGSRIGWGEYWSMPIKVVKGRWVTYTFHEHFGPDGWIELWVDGIQQTFSDNTKRIYLSTQTSSNNSGLNHIKINNYRPRGARGNVTLFHDGLKVGSSREIVEGDFIRK